MRTKAGKWFRLFIVVFMMLLLCCASTVVVLDPYFHYHKPLPSFSYVLNNERAQNDGITKHFAYDTLLTGTSLVEVMKASEVERQFGGKAVKVTFAGASFYEINRNIELAFATHPHLKRVIRCLDMEYYFDDPKALRTNMGVYPTWLYNRNPFDDVRYLFNREVLFTLCGDMIRKKLAKEAGGITSFDDYANWMPDVTADYFGAEALLGGMKPFGTPSRIHHLTEEEKSLLRANIRENVTETAKKYPDCVFDYFISPYSGLWWAQTYEAGDLAKVLEAEEIVVSEIVACPNIHLYSYNTDTSLTWNLDNYKDPLHYGDWIGEELLVFMKRNEGRITKKTMEAYLKKERELYETLDYAQWMKEELAGKYSGKTETKGGSGSK